MARKNVLPYQLVTSQSLDDDFISSVTSINYTDNISYQINCFTTDSIGTFNIEVSNDYKVDNVTGVVINAGNWVPLTLAGGTPFVNASDAVIEIALNQVPYGAMRVTYTSGTPGNGTCDIYFLSKQLGG